MRFPSVLSVVVVLLLLELLSACKHDALFDAAVPGPTDTLPGDPPNTGGLCDPDTVYFQSQILPLLISRCTEPGCHGAASAEIQLIQTWIAQGAKNNGCNANFAGCDSTSFTWSAFVQPLIQTQCQGCHSGSAPQGGINLGSYAAVKAQVTNGKLYASVTRSFAYMPKGGNRLDDCTIKRLKTWIDAGAPEN